MFNGDIVINSRDFKRNGADPWQIINFDPWRQLYLEKREKRRTKKNCLVCCLSGLILLFVSRNTCV